jgi:hypothetical protein
MKESKPLEEEEEEEGRRPVLKANAKYEEKVIEGFSQANKPLRIIMCG